jgi:hypothetical protein
VKFDISVNGTRLDNWGSCAITLDAAFSASAEFVIHSPGAGPWLTNLSKVLVTGRDCRPESAAWGFENASDSAAWSVSNANVVSAGIDYTEAAYGSGSWALDWSAPAQLVELTQQYSVPFGMNGRSFWGWFRVDYLTAFTPQVSVQAFATDGVSEWSSAQTILSLLPTVGWQAVGLKVAPTNTVPQLPDAITRWGFRLQFHDAIPPAQAGLKIIRLHVDSIELCGRSYGESYQMPPFAASAPNGCLQPALVFPCSKWGAFVWGDELHAKPGDAGWCPQGAVWDSQQKWGDARYPAPTDVQWG